MTDDPITPVVEDVTDPNPPPSTPPPPVNIVDRPPWVDEIVEAVTAIPDAIAQMTPNPVSPDPEPPIVPEPDESPVKKPWTHKKPWS